ncbi:MAG: hypothetical protein ABR509_04120 [Candidatus Limnocylindria bacterium]
MPISLPGAPGGRPAPRDEAARLLGVSADADLTAFVDRFGAPGPLHVLDADGSDADVAVGPSGGAAPLAAAFAPDASWLAAVDGAGGLWRVDLGSAAPSLISGGSDGFVYGLTIDTLPDSRLLLAQVASVTVPVPSRVVAVDVESGGVDVLSEAGMAYQPTSLDDGSIAYFASNPDGSTALRLLSGRSETTLAELGQTAAVDVSPDGRHVAVERGDGTVELIAVDGGLTRNLGRGARPRFAPTSDRLSVLDLDTGVTRALDLGGRELSRTPSPLAAWVQCPEGCAP